jgi:hypothetical protein
VGGLPAVAGAGYVLVSDGVDSWAADQTPAWTGEHSFAAGIAFTGATGVNVVTIPDNLVDAFHIIDTGDADIYFKIVTATDFEGVIFNAGGDNVNFTVQAIGVADALQVQGSDGQIILGALTAGYVKSSAGGILSVATEVPLIDLGSYTQGDLVYGGAADWQDLAIGAIGDFLWVNAAGTEPEWHTLVAGDVPAHALLGTQHSDTVVNAPTRGSMITGLLGGGALLVWDELVHPGTAYHLQTDANDIVWAQNITMADGASIGIGAGLERIVFNTAGYVTVRGANFGVGVANPVYKVVAGGVASPHLQLLSTTDAGICSILFGDASAAGPGRLRYDHSANKMELYTNGAVKFTVLSGGNAGFGTGAPGGTVEIVGELRLSGTDSFVANACQLYRSATSGLVISGCTGTSFDLLIFGSDNTPLIRNATGTDNLTLCPDTGKVVIGGPTPQAMMHAISDAVFSSASYVAGGHTAFLTNTTEAAGADVVGASIAFGGPGRADRGLAAIAAIQGTADIDQVGLVFFTHPSAPYGDAIVEKMRLTYAGVLKLAGLAGVGTRNVSADANGNLIIA